MPTTPPSARPIRPGGQTIIAALLGLLFSVSCLLTAATAATITDHEGQSLTVARPFSRIISLYPAHTENLFALGLDAAVIGVAKNDDFPVAAQSKPRFDYREDPERIIAARPDLVLVRPMISRSAPELLARLRAVGIRVVSLQPNTLEETFAYWQTLGTLTGKEEAATGMVTEFNRRLAAIRAVVAAIPQEKRQRVYFEAIHSKVKTFAPDSMAIFALTTAGGINVATDADQVRDTNIAAYGTERLMAKGGAIDLFLAQKGRMNPVSERTIADEPGFQTIKAVKEGKIFLIDEALVARPTLRMIDGIIAIGRILYPESFSKAHPAPADATQGK